MNPRQLPNGAFLVLCIAAAMRWARKGQLKLAICFSGFYPAWVAVQWTPKGILVMTDDSDVFS